MARVVPGPSAIALLLAAALAPAASGCATTGASRREVGVVVVHGVDQALCLDLQGAILPIAGRAPVLAQLDRIVDARIEFRGNVGKRQVSVRSFEMIEAPDGMAPFVGRVVVDQAGTMLADETTGTRIALRSSELESLALQHGARVWVTGLIVGPQLLLVAHWGVIAPASVK